LLPQPTEWPRIGNHIDVLRDFRSIGDLLAKNRGFSPTVSGGRVAIFKLVTRTPLRGLRSPQLARRGELARRGVRAAFTTMQIKSAWPDAWGLALTNNTSKIHIIYENTNFLF
jgi:hypothetical protein